MDKADRKMLRDIEHYDWHVLKVMEDDEGPAFAFTVGLHHSFKHPEVLMIGLDLDSMHNILNNIGDDIKKGAKYQAGREYPEIVADYKCSFQKIDKRYYKDYLGTAMSFYNPESFPALQCIYPDKSGRYPWNNKCSKAFREQEPVLTIKPVER
jgi:hypothetical protein